MGWTTYHREPGQSNRDHFQEMLGDGYELGENATIRGTFYAALKLPDGTTTAYVALTHRAPKAEYNFGYKDMTESMGPSVDECPAKVLDALSPLDALFPWDGEGEEPSSRKWAREWRERCRERIAAKAARPKVKRGDRVTFAEPLTFTSGAVLQTLTFLERSTFRDADGNRFRVTRWRDRGYTIA